MQNYVAKSWIVMAGDAKTAEGPASCKFIISSFGVRLETMIWQI